MKSNRILPETIESIDLSGIDFDQWLGGFESVQCAVLGSVNKIRQHPLIPKNITTEGLLIDSATGEISVIK